MINLFYKLICSIPVILLILYWFPFLGVCFLILRYYMYHDKKNQWIPFILIIIGLLILLPKVLSNLFDIMSFHHIIVSNLDILIRNKLYAIKLISYSKFLIITGIILLMISFAFRKVKSKLQYFFQSYLSRQEQNDHDISVKNDFIMKEKQMKAKNTQVVYCKYCGADNILTSKFGTCKYCRRKIKK